MPDPITIGAIALNVGCGIGGNVMQAFGVGGYRRVADILTRGTADENHDILKATHSAYVEAMEVMAASCSNLALGKEEKVGARQLKALVKRKDFRDFRFDGEHFPLSEANAAIDRMFTGGIGAGGGAEDEHRAYNQIIVGDLAAWDVTLPPGLAALFVDGGEGHGPWHLVFRTAFAEQVKNNQTAFRILTWERLNELRAMGIAVLDQFEALHVRFDAVEAMLREVLTNQAPDREHASIELLQSLADGYAESHPDDAEGLKIYLLQKIEQWREFRARIEALEAEGNRDSALLADARAATDRGDFNAADALLAEAEEALDEKLDALLIAKSERRSLRGDNAQLAGDYRTAVAFYDEAADLLPQAAIGERISRRYSAAGAMQEWGERFGDSHLLPDAVARWRSLVGVLDDATPATERANLLNKLGIALRSLGARQVDTDALQEAVAAYRTALEVLTRETHPLAWAATQNNLSTALVTLGERTERTEELEEAVGAFRASLKEYTREAHPLDWAMTHNNLGIALAALGDRQAKAEVLREAVEAYRAALEVHTRDMLPLEWAMTQNNLGIALRRLGARSDGTKALEGAVTAYRAALEVYTRETAPVRWASTQCNLGVALHTLGARCEGTHALDEAVTAYRAALEVLRRGDLALDWAMTQANIGMALLTKAQKTGLCEDARSAAQQFECALEVFVHPSLAWYREREETNLADAQALVERLCT